MSKPVVTSVNPASGEALQTFTPHGSAEVDAAIERADEAFRTWRLTSFTERSRLMHKAADILDARKEAFARTMTMEMGKPLSEAVAEVEKCALVCRHYADHAEDYLRDEVIETEASQSFVRNLPMGPVLAVMPWNFPFWQVFRFAAPTLMAGNVGLLKHASNVWGSALNIAKVFREAGFPEGCFQTLLIGSKAVEGVIRDARVKAVTLTGSGPAGRSVAMIAGEELKPSLLELGGSDAFIVMPSADLGKAVETAVKSRTRNNGQSCIAAKRFLVHTDVYDAFTQAFVARIEALRVGDPLLEETDIGPLATEAIRDELAGQVEATLKGGAKRISKLAKLPGKGWWFAPQVLAEAPDGTPGAEQEMFGPVANLWRVSSLDDAIARANRSDFGLGSAIFTQDAAEIAQAVRDIEAGSTFVNALVASDPRLPFGGVKQSGYGRELAADGIKAFVNRKTVSIS
ncbi:MAG: succinate-semialdehyde dehydrogenase [Hyphomonas sp. BRH_c22]|uniref:NAD-dependent succinate-semialdehyde dehydrogenase n=1 Tax=Hyphomonas sp. BRH_c22 TaxID=1629710 RepID=UPI0005F26A08|nr:NAD-dependent succinate-semialdehyde dehydrogenase [Hyphomonas sp. BRH_c22]KJS36913.1 MAG: succinate-semialdehyde dehydrogenase [Hyphomonas sp. BRH_c22]